MTFEEYPGLSVEKCMTAFYIKTKYVYNIFVAVDNL